MSLPGSLLAPSLLGLVFGHLDLLSVVARCWLVCKAWARQRMHASSATLEFLAQLEAVEPLCVRDLTVAAWLHPDAGQC